MRQVITSLTRKLRYNLGVLRHLLILTVLATAFAVAIPNLAAVPRGNSDDFLISKWTTENGLPQNTVTSITQTSDGYLWLGTFGGLARFDGIHFTVFDATNTPNFKANRVLAVQRNSKEGLWVGTDSGLVYMVRGNELTEFDSGLEFDRTAVWGIEQDSQNILYISSTSGIESFLLDEAGWPVAGSGRVLARGEAYSLYKDRNGRVWAKLGGDIILLDQSEVTNISSLGYKLPLSTYEIAFDESGRLFAAASATLGEVSVNRYREVLSLDYTIHRSGSSIAYADGRIWFQQANELYEIAGTELTVHDLGDYVRTGSRAIFEDNERNIWIATQTDGLVRISHRKIRSMATVLSKDLTGVYSVAEDASKTIWFTGNRLSGVKENQTRSISRVPDGGTFPTLKTLVVDRQDRLWAGGILGLYYLEHEELIPVPEFSKLHVQSLFTGKNGDLWIGTETGLYVRRGEEVFNIFQDTGSTYKSIHYITQDSGGTLWVGTKSGMARVNADSLKMEPGPDAFAGDFVRDIIPLDDGTMWVGTYGAGLKRFKDGEVATLSTANGLPNNFISRILVVGDGKFWILTNVGIFVVTREELEKVADGSAGLLGGAAYGVSDGMRSSEANGGHQPAGIRSSDGRLWFPMIDDLVSIDPKEISDLPPQVIIENALSRIGERAVTGLPLKFDNSKGIDIDYGVRNLEIQYSGISLTKPEAVRYVYRLEGLDADWVFAGDRRTAFYPYLPAGNYHFFVRAISADGVWSEVTGIEIRVAEHFWESRWFASIIFAGLLAIAALIFWWRFSHLKERQFRKEQFARQLINAGEWNVAAWQLSYTMGSVRICCSSRDGPRLRATTKAVARHNLQIT